MKHIRDKWNLRYAAVHVPNKVIDVLELNQHLLPEGGKSLDLACGLGGNALRMAELGFTSYAWDISDSAINKVREFAQERQLELLAQQVDISQLQQQQEMIRHGFDVVIVSRFLLRDIVAQLITALNPGGLIFYQTFVNTQNDGPKNPDFRLASNELLQLFSALTIRFYREDGVLGDMTRGIRNEAMLVAQKI